MFKYQPWRALHCVINRLAWRHTTSREHWLWRLNNWCADHYVSRFVTDIAARNNARREAEDAEND